MPAKKKVTRRKPNVALATLRRENNYLRKRVLALEEREQQLLNRIMSLTEPEDTGYEDLDLDWVEREETFGKDLISTNRRSTNDLYKEAQERHYTRETKRKAEAEEKAKEKEPNIIISGEKKRQLVETAKAIRAGE